MRGDEQKSNSAPRSVFEGGNSGSRDRENFSRLLFLIRPSSWRSTHSESRKEQALKSGVKRGQPLVPSQNTKYPRKFHPMASSTPEKKKKKKEEVTLIRTTWALGKPRNRVESDWGSKPNKNKQTDLNLCRVRDEDDGDGGHDDTMYF